MPHEKPSPWAQSGFTEEMRLRALELRTRIQNGENIPLSDLQDFILSAERNLEGNRVKPAPAPKAAPAQDVDFF